MLGAGDSGRVIVFVVVVSGIRRRRMRTQRPVQSVYKPLFVADLVLQTSQPVFVQRLSLHLANEHNTSAYRLLGKRKHHCDQRMLIDVVVATFVQSSANESG